MKTVLLWLGGALLFLAFLFAVMWIGRAFSNATTPVTVHRPVPGVTCAALVTSDGAAISCWKD